MVENIPNLGKLTEIQIQEAQESSKQDESIKNPHWDTL